MMPRDRRRTYVRAKCWLAGGALYDAAMSARERSWSPSSARAIGLALLASALVHVGGYAVLRWSSSMPSVDFELTLPSEVEFGLTEAAAVAPPPPLPAPTEASPPPTVAAGDQ